MYIVAYDISSTKERSKVAKVLTDFGERVQKSVWSCDIDYTKCNELKHRLSELNLKTGYIDIWLSNSEPVRIGASDSVPEHTFAHCL